MQGQRFAEVCQMDYMNDVRKFVLNDRIRFPKLTINRMSSQDVFEDEIRDILCHGNSYIYSIMESSPSRRAMRFEVLGSVDKIRHFLIKLQSPAPPDFSLIVLDVEFRAA